MEKQDLHKTYSYFADTFEKNVLESVSLFFENKFKVFLAQITQETSLKESPLLKNELFYTCKIPIKNKQYITLRLTSDFIRIVFHDVFGSSAPVFELAKLTELEQRILNSFFEFIVKNMEPLIIKEDNAAKIDPLDKTELNFVFLIRSKDVNAGKLSAVIPQNRLVIKNVPCIQNFTYDDFLNNFAYVNLIAGGAKISLNDLKNLDKDDIIVLENSNVKTMTLKTGTIVHKFGVNPEPSLMLDLEEDEEIEFTEEKKEYKEQNMPEPKTMWDDIQIEISAEFERVKMSLGDLKQISKGLVIDLGPVMNNEISLFVENKVVAKGELVILNDKYGVKITEVFASKKEDERQNKLKPKQPLNKEQQIPKAPNPQASAAQQAPKMPLPRPVPQKAQAAPNAPAQEDKGDFDYSNFEE